MTDSPPHKKQKHGSSGDSSAQPEPGPYEDDAALIALFAKQAEEPGSNRRYLLWKSRVARKFSGWLRKTGRPPLAGRLSQLDGDLQAYTTALSDSDRGVLYIALEHLRAVAAGRAIVRLTPGPRASYRQKQLFENDAQLISRAAMEAESEVTKQYWETLENAAHKFGAWLRQTGRQPMADRLNHQLNADFQVYMRTLEPYSRQLLSRALKRFQNVVAGRPVGHVIPSRAGPVKAMCAEDERLISGFRMAHLPVQPATVRVYASALRGFSNWLQAQKKRSIASRLYDDTLTQDAEHYSVYEKHLSAALRHLRKLCRAQAQSSAGPGTQYMVVAPDVSTSYEPRHDAQVTPASAVLRPLSPAGRGEPSSAYGGSAAPGASSEAAGWPDDFGFPDDFVLSKGDQELFKPFLDDAAAEGAPQHGASPEAAGWRDDFGVLDDFDLGEGDQELIMSLLDDAAAESAPQHGASQVPPPFVGGTGDASPPWDQATGRSSFAGTSEASSSFVARPSEDDFGRLVGLGWQHGSQPAPHELIRALDTHGLLPGPCRPTHLRIFDRSYSAQWAATGRSEVATLNNLLGGDVMLIPEPGFEHQGPVEVRPGTVPSFAVAASSTAGASSSGQGGSQALYGLPDIGVYVPQDFAHGDQYLPDAMLWLLRQWDLLPTDVEPTRAFAIRNEIYTAQWCDESLYLKHHARR
ncbi:hypothetical protein NLM33_40780 [Bradyrhizobium sp. CCGUVB1N3]|uniref:hypothetical protein n=1 Tax=Bradyrhizobium sp. CCGUVB1N3 TaxID=2949629 RepID=UPI0020B26A7E|nr:hypothetical protein [Bradyrhizobium sp. CCGUVB1N3]MCP3476544.1 hypothetical protein [Bradyrhizobium sp. CCGUVB1N3]